MNVFLLFCVIINSSLIFANDNEWGGKCFEYFKASGQTIANTSTYCKGGVGNKCFMTFVNSQFSMFAAAENCNERVGDRCFDVAISNGNSLSVSAKLCKNVVSTSCLESYLNAKTLSLASIAVECKGDISAPCFLGYLKEGSTLKRAAANCRGF